MAIFFLRSLSSFFSLQDVTRLHSIAIIPRSYLRIRLSSLCNFATKAIVARKICIVRTLRKISAKIACIVRRNNWLLFCSLPARDTAFILPYLNSNPFLPKDPNNCGLEFKINDCMIRLSENSDADWSKLNILLIKCRHFYSRDMSLSEEDFCQNTNKYNTINLSLFLSLSLFAIQLPSTHHHAFRSFLRLSPSCYSFPFLPRSCTPPLRSESRGEKAPLPDWPSSVPLIPLLRSARSSGNVRVRFTFHSRERDTYTPLL